MTDETSSPGAAVLSRKLADKALRPSRRGQPEPCSKCSNTQRRKRNNTNESATRRNIRGADGPKRARNDATCRHGRSNTRGPGPEQHSRRGRAETCSKCNNTLRRTSGAETHEARTSRNVLEMQQNVEADRAEPRHSRRGRAETCSKCHSTWRRERQDERGRSMEAEPARKSDGQGKAGHTSAGAPARRHAVMDKA